jgi:hypothetical protein
VFTSAREVDAGEGEGTEEEEEDEEGGDDDGSKEATAAEVSGKGEADDDDEEEEEEEEEEEDDDDEDVDASSRSSTLGSAGSFTTDPDPAMNVPPLTLTVPTLMWTAQWTTLRGLPGPRARDSARSCSDNASALLFLSLCSSRCRLLSAVSLLLCSDCCAASVVFSSVPRSANLGK